MEFRKYKIMDLYNVSSGLSKKKEEFGHGYPFLTFKNVFYNTFLPDVLTEKANTTIQEREKASIRRGDVFLTRTSEKFNELGKSSVALTDYAEATFNGFTKRLRPKNNCNNILLPEYAGYFFRAHFFSDQILRMSTMSTRASLNNEMISKLYISIPSIENQIKISNILLNFDNKIEINNKVINNLEQISQTLFKHWFIDFEFPNEEGQPYKSSGGKMVESELGEIPEGWAIKKIKDLVEVIDNRGKTPPLAKGKTNYPIIDVKVVSGSSRIIDFDKALKFVERNTYDTWFRRGHPKEGDVLLSTVGSVGETKLFMGEKGCIAQNIVALRGLGNENFYLYEYLKSIKNELLTYNIGSVQPSIKITHIIKKDIIVPEDSIIEKYNLIYKTINEKIFLLSEESEGLKQLRDTLLPKLLSGEIEIPDDLEV